MASTNGAREIAQGVTLGRPAHETGKSHALNYFRVDVAMKMRSDHGRWKERSSNEEERFKWCTESQGERRSLSKSPWATGTNHADAAVKRFESEGSEKDRIFIPDLRENVKSESVDNPLLVLASETITVMERLKDLIGTYADDELGYWIDGERFGDVLQRLITRRVIATE
jgi:hypothetical protein